MSSTNYKLSWEKISELEKMKWSWTTPKEIQKRINENINKMFEETELTIEEKKAIDKIIKNDLTIESNREFQWVKWNFVSLKLWNNWKSYKIFFPDGTTEQWLDLLIKNSKDKFVEIGNYFKENWINKPLKISLLYLLGDIIKTPFHRPQDSTEQKNYIPVTIKTS